MTQNSGKIIGIDLGTTNSAVAVMEGGSPKVIPTAEGRNLIPSIVALKGDEVLVGDPAKRQIVMNSQSTAHSVKRFMGRKFKDTAVQNALKHIAYEIAEGKDGMVVVIIAINQATGEIIYGPDIVTRGFVFEDESQEFLDETKRVVLDTLATVNTEVMADWSEVKQEVRRILRRFFNKTIERRPVILPVIMEI